jgi:hypothetical protein
MTRFVSRTAGQCRARAAMGANKNADNTQLRAITDACARMGAEASMFLPSWSPRPALLWIAEKLSCCSPAK